MKTLARLVYRHRDPILYRILFGFSVWYFLECLLLLFRGDGLWLNYLWTAALVEFYLAAVAVYAYETYIHPRNRWGHWIAIFWFAAFLLTILLITFRSEAISSLENAALVIKVSSVVIFIWFLKEYRKRHPR